MADDKMIQLSGIYRNHYISHSADFIARDPITFIPNYAANWQAQIQLSLAQETDETRDDQLTMETADVAAKMADARALKDLVQYFARKAFPGNTLMLNKFGLDNYGKDSSSDYGMAKYLHNVHAVCTQNAAALIAVGFSQLEIDSIQTLGNELHSEDVEQETFMRNTPEATAAREAVHNATWGYVQLVNELAKIIYRNNPILLNKFLLPRNSEQADVFNFVGQATDSATGLPLADVLTNILPINVSRDTDADGNYGYGSIPAGAYTFRVSKAGYVTQNIPITILAGQPLTVNVALVPL